MTTFIALTRVYKDKKAGSLKTQKITVNVANIESVRPSNRLGHPDHRSTMVMVSGGEIDLADTYSDVRKKIVAS